MGASFIYFGGKFLAYSAWCYFGLRVYSGPRIPVPLAAPSSTVLFASHSEFFFGILIYLLSSALITSLAPGLPET